MLSQKINELFAYPDQPTYLHWTMLLIFFEEHKTKLTFDQKSRIYNKCEEYRLYFSGNRTKKVKVATAFRVKEVTLEISGKVINKEDVFPRIYDHFDPDEKLKDVG